MNSPAREDWIDQARRADIWAVLSRVAQHSLKLRNQRAVGPCPACGGHDRFSIDRRKNVFYCRRSAKGGDAIALVQYLEGADFLGACEIINGAPPPDGQSGQMADPEWKARRDQLRAADDEKRRRADFDFRAQEIARAAKIWREGIDFVDTPVQQYLALRGVVAPAGARLRYHADLKFWDWSAAAKAFVVLHRGPAMLARIDDGDHRFMGVHCTYLDLAQPKGKAEIFSPETGEQLPAKKMRGAKKGGHIHLGGPSSAHKLFVGEGIETVLSVRSALARAGRHVDDCLFWASGDLGNIGGPSRESIAHPSQKRIDSKGRARAVKVPGPVPAFVPGELVLMPPDHCAQIFLLGDGDSDRFSTEQHLRRAAARWALPFRSIRVAWAHAGADFNDMWRGAA